jgi:prepilin-type N-terminal cleavage/methylation domain-containing protein
MPTLLPHNEGQAMRRGFTLTEALMAILILGVGLLSLMALYPLAVLHINEALRNNRVAQAVQNARALLEIYRSTSNLPVPSGSPVWWFPQNAMNQRLAPDLSADPVPVPITSIQKAPNPILNYALYDFQNAYANLEGPYLFAPSAYGKVPTGYRFPQPDPTLYTWAYLIRPVPLPPDNPDKLLADVSVVVFEDYNENDMNHKPEQLPGATLTKDSTVGTNLSTSGWVLDANNGYMYRVVSPNNLELPARKDSDSVYLMRRVVEVVELGVIAVR